MIFPALLFSYLIPTDHPSSPRIVQHRSFVHKHSFILETLTLSGLNKWFSVPLPSLLINMTCRGEQMVTLSERIWWFPWWSLCSLNRAAAPSAFWDVAFFVKTVVSIYITTLHCNLYMHLPQCYLSRYIMAKSYSGNPKTPDASLCDDYKTYTSAVVFYSGVRPTTLWIIIIFAGRAIEILSKFGTEET